MPGDESFPDGVWQIEIRGQSVNRVKGEDIIPKGYGVFFRIPAEGDRDERLAFWPWSEIKRMYQVG
jgi:hypothetical protein